MFSETDHFNMIETYQTFRPLNYSWIENLAMDEINMDESGMVNINGHLNPSLLLEESSIEIMNNIRDQFEAYMSKFNEHRGRNHSSAAIKLFKISNTVNDFMLFRNSLRLVFARKANDIISIGFLANGKDIYGARLSFNEQFGSTTIHEIKAHMGPFNKITWRFNNEEIDFEAMVRHYLTEFIVNSAR
jgi:hypothetical protein